MKLHPRRLKDAAKRAEQVKTAAKALDGALNDFITKYIGDHHSLLKKHNATLGMAKGAAKKASDQARQAGSHVTSMVRLLTK